MINVNELPYLTSEIPGIGGEIKSRPEDFVVEEIPLYEPSGEGTHVYFRMQKKGLATMPAIRELGRALGRKNHDFGYAGLKDADAVTTQTVSLEHIDPKRIETLDLPRIRILSVSRHRNKLKIGHLKGNRFAIKIRNANTSRAEDVQRMMSVLAKRGVPNYFGVQRFGMRGDTWQIGRAMLRGDFDEAVAVMLGRPGPMDSGDVQTARQLFEQGDYAAAGNAWPYPFRAERTLCRSLHKAKGNAERAFRAVDKQLRRFFISAYQSQLFNQIVAQRLDSLDQLMAGDLAWRHVGGAVFTVEDEAIEQPRCDTFEISPSGPLFGYRMSAPTGVPGEMERTLIELEGAQPQDWRETGKHQVKGARRPIRFRPQDPSVIAGTDDAAPYIEISFTLDAGCYATTVLREICK